MRYNPKSVDAYLAGTTQGHSDMIHNIYDQTNCMPPAKYAQYAADWHKGYDQALKDYLSGF